MADLNKQVQTPVLENTPGLEIHEEPKSPLSKLTEIVKDKTKTTLKTATAAAMLSASIVNAAPATEPVNSPEEISTEAVKVPVEVSTEVQAFSPEDQKVYEEYLSKLPEELKSFALELMKWREEFKENYENTDIFKTIKEKLTKRGKYNEKNRARMLENGWNAFAVQLLDWSDSKYYDDVVELAPNLSKFIYENKENLLSYNSKINYWLDFVIMAFETEEQRATNEELELEYQQQKAANEELKKLNNWLNKLNWNLVK